MKRYKLIKDYPNQQIGDIAIVDRCPYTYESYWEGHKGKGIPHDFRPDLTPEWFEEVEEKKVIFIAEDGKEIHPGDNYFYTSNIYPGIKKQTCDFNTIFDEEILIKKFYSEKAAEEFLFKNYYKFSLQEIIDLYPDFNTTMAYAKLYQHLLDTKE